MVTEAPSKPEVSGISGPHSASYDPTSLESSLRTTPIMERVRLLRKSAEARQTAPHTVTPTWQDAGMAGPDPTVDIDRLLRELQDLLLEFEEGAREGHNRDLLRSWNCHLMDDPVVRQVLHKLAKRGAHLPALLYAGLRFLLDRGMFTEEIAQIDFVPVSPETATPFQLDQIVRQIEELEKAAGSPVHIQDLPPTPLLKHFEKRRAMRQAWLNEHADEFRDEYGLEDPQATVGFIHPGASSELDPIPDIERSQGIRPDLAESVLSLLVSGHMLAACGNRSTTLVGRFIFEILRVSAPRCDVASENVQAWAKRVRNHWGNPAMRRRATILAGLLSLPIRFD